MWLPSCGAAARCPRSTPRRRYVGTAHLCLFCPNPRIFFRYPSHNSLLSVGCCGLASTIVPATAAAAAAAAPSPSPAIPVQSLAALIQPHRDNAREPCPAVLHRSSGVPPDGSTRSSDADCTRPWPKCMRTQTRMDGNQGLMHQPHGSVRVLSITPIPVLGASPAQRMNWPRPQQLPLQRRATRDGGRDHKRGAQACACVARQSRRERSRHGA